MHNAVIRHHTDDRADRYDEDSDYSAHKTNEGEYDAQISSVYAE